MKQVVEPNSIILYQYTLTEGKWYWFCWQQIHVAFEISITLKKTPTPPETCPPS